MPASSCRTRAASSELTADPKPPVFAGSMLHVVCGTVAEYWPWAFVVTVTRGSAGEMDIDARHHLSVRIVGDRRRRSTPWEASVLVRVGVRVGVGGIGGVAVGGIAVGGRSVGVGAAPPNDTMRTRRVVVGADEQSLLPSGRRAMPVGSLNRGAVAGPPSPETPPSPLPATVVMMCCAELSIMRTRMLCESSTKRRAAVVEGEQRSGRRAAPGRRGPPSPLKPGETGARVRRDDAVGVDAADAVVERVGDVHDAAAGDGDVERILQLGGGGRPAVAAVAGGCRCRRWW